MLYYKIMDTKTIVMCVVALILGMLMANMLKNVCGCKSVEGLDECVDCKADVDRVNYWWNADPLYRACDPVCK